MNGLTLVDVCSGAGGLALGLERAGFSPTLLLDEDADACRTLQTNRPGWNVLQADLLEFSPEDHPESYDVDLLSAGTPRVKSSATARRIDSGDEERLLKAAVYLTHAIGPRALLVENVPTLAHSDRFRGFRDFAHAELEHLGYDFNWFVLDAADFGVPQERRQGVLVALKKQWFPYFRIPSPNVTDHVSAGQALASSMRSRGWLDADRWAAHAGVVAPTLVGGSKKRGGADLGPTGTKKKWERLGVNAHSLGDAVPGPDFVWEPERGREGMVRLTVDQTALLQSFPEEWEITGKKTARYRQIGHASPPPVGETLGRAIARALRS
ncbi:DNA cytosine methyltransferase [Streptomyces acidiscabies]|uniref:DNA (cytosine-5-)-methyltransferase n=1 Tax=Streptomyces acidiscabies TaxID=42234 RepID=A0AAP6B7C1_9ACTN|nr:DNA cytosine methyltransferase [Streptomyces acidiscabies]MBP5939392.1 DNA cytosine methyltransferase [Streptomyces sp. LBUM 1476]MBZ3910532.1 DNA cytosine methyltransferase [Streptomyces acidiscabies]MDX2959532.1 DNA cytosine methyltransferase [Streptomyces acidiscabies]MDX3019180.1 DNA cytosine methyltransferase [Streptomyces acidiscabies]MDX3790739.1 DNA cytosine methyltransferase [Streptomyces acidiscabies]